MKKINYINTGKFITMNNFANDFINYYKWTKKTITSTIKTQYTISSSKERQIILKSLFVKLNITSYNKVLISISKSKLKVMSDL